MDAVEWTMAAVATGSSVALWVARSRRISREAAAARRERRKAALAGAAAAAGRTTRPGSSGQAD